MGLAQEENLVVFYIHLPWETERDNAGRNGERKRI